MPSTYLIPWPGPHVTPLILMKEHLELMAMQSSPTNQKGNNYDSANNVKIIHIIMITFGLVIRNISIEYESHIYLKGQIN